MSEKENVYVACPLHDGQMQSGTAMSLASLATKKRIAHVTAMTGSLLAMNFNAMYCVALSNRKQSGYRWFAMLHGDIQPDPWWIDTLIDTAEKYNADVLSAVSPIKDARGITSTALSDPDDPWQPYTRLTQRQLWHESIPETFNTTECILGLKNMPDGLRIDPPAESKLLVNTGCFVTRLDRDWSDKVFFSINDRIVKRDDGDYEAQVEPEDWHFSRQVHSFGGNVMATKKVHLIHHGNIGYDSASIWGDGIDPATNKAA